MNATQLVAKGDSSGVEARFHERSFFETLSYFEQPGGAHAAADAHGHQYAFNTKAPPFDPTHGRSWLRSAHANGCPIEDRAAVPHCGRSRRYRAGSRNRALAGEQLRYLHQINVVDLSHCRDNRSATETTGQIHHLVGAHPRERQSPERAERFDAAMLASFALISTHAEGAVGELARIAGRDGSASRHRREPGEACDACVGKICLIASWGDASWLSAWVVLFRQTFFTVGQRRQSRGKIPA